MGESPAEGSYHGYRLAWPCPEHAVGEELRVWGCGEHVVKPCGCSYHGHIRSCPCPEHDPRNARTQGGEVRRLTDLDGRLWEVHERRLGVAAGGVPQASPMFTFQDPFTGASGLDPLVARLGGDAGGAGSWSPCLRLSSVRFRVYLYCPARRQTSSAVRAYRPPAPLEAEPAAHRVKTRAAFLPENSTQPRRRVLRSKVEAHLPGRGIDFDLREQSLTFDRASPVRIARKSAHHRIGLSERGTNSLS
jgi:hypothetical protein